MDKITFRKIIFNKAVIISSLGYFVDVFDLVLFGIVRVSSLHSLGVQDSEMIQVGIQLLNWQMAGLLLGGLVWGYLADRIGRTKVLYGSIFIYSIANLANGFVTTIPVYTILRFISGFGLAGELGVAVTLVSEQLPITKRSIGSAIIGIFGFLGAICAALLGSFISWNNSYIVGGILGLLLLVARIKVNESELFLHYKKKIQKNNVSIFSTILNLKRLSKFVLCILVGVPIWYISGLLIYFSSEFAKELGILTPVLNSKAIFWSYLGSMIGDPLASLFSQILQSRKKGIFIFIILSALFISSYFFIPKQSSDLLFYFICFLLGIANGYWTLFVTMISEQFGTNIRATITTSIPNLVRGIVIPLTLVFLSLKDKFGQLNSALAIGFICIFLALISLANLSETFNKNLDYIET